MPKTHFFHLSILTGIFVLVNGLWFWKMGVMTDADTWGYLQYADEIKENGLFFKPHLFWYIVRQLELPLSDAGIAFGVFGGRGCVGRKVGGNKVKDTRLKTQDVRTENFLVASSTESRNVRIEK